MSHSALIGSLEHEPFKIYASGEPRPFSDHDGIGDGPTVYGCIRVVPINDDGSVTLTAEGLRDLCNYVYRCGWRMGNLCAGKGTQG